MRSGGERWLERNRVFRAAGRLGDPLLASQWSLRAAGVPPAWDTTKGGRVTVAVLDSGIQAHHPDLASNLWTNPGELAGNGIDDDGNGFVDDLHGADVLSGSGRPRDRLGHGTAVAGVIGARLGNGIGLAGVAPRVRLLPVKVLDDRGHGTTATLVDGIRYTLAQGARVINMSVNGPDGCAALDEAIQAAEAEGAVVVASAGNDGQDRDQVASYPAAVASVAVASTGRAAGALRVLVPGAATSPLRVLRPACRRAHSSRRGRASVQPS